MRAAALCVVLLVACIQVEMRPADARERRHVRPTAADGRLGRLEGGHGAPGTCWSKRSLNA